jgi:Holliday junction resolvasome RuvABC endonuclease subunit
MGASSTLGLDLASTVGWACGAAGERPRLGSVKLGGPTRAARYAAFLEWLDDAAATYGVASVVFEAPFVGGDFKGADAARMALGLVAHLDLWAWDNAIPLAEVHVGTARKDVLGRGNFPKGTSKAVVLDWARAEGFDPPTHDAADALVVWAHHTGWRRRHTALLGARAAG